MLNFLLELINEKLEVCMCVCRRFYSEFPFGVADDLTKNVGVFPTEMEGDLTKMFLVFFRGSLVEVEGDLTKLLINPFHPTCFVVFLEAL